MDYFKELSMRMSYKEMLEHTADAADKTKELLEECFCIMDYIVKCMSQLEDISENDKSSLKEIMESLEVAKVHYQCMVTRIDDINQNIERLEERK